MGYLEYAGAMFFDKDWTKTKLLTSDRFRFTQFFRDGEGFVCIFPEPTVTESEEEETISLMGYEFPADGLGKTQLTALFRAAVFHVSAHVATTNVDNYAEWGRGRNPRLTKFTSTLLEDIKANAYIASRHPDKLRDLAFASALALKRLRRINSFINPTTKMTAGLLVKSQIGVTAIKSENEQKTVARLAELLDKFKEKALLSFKDEKVNLKDAELEVANEIYKSIDEAGTVTETPFLPHTEELGKCSVFFPSNFVASDVTLEGDFKKCLDFMHGSASRSEGQEQERKLAEAEAVQIYDSWWRQREKNQKIISKYANLLSTTRFKSVEIPDQDYTEFLRVKARSKSEANRLIESLLVARDAVDEDPRKNYGVLDLQDVVQVIASQSPRMDVFMLDENISKSYSWVLLLDASRSMECVKDFALEIMLILGEVANELLLDPTSWGIYAFNDRFLVIKDLKERYNARVKSRLGGLKFEGFTYMPDALSVAGQILKTRSENLRLITIVSDGWPYGYSEMDAALSEILGALTAKNVSVVGIGAKTRRMAVFFKSNCTVYSLRDLAKKFSTQFFEASNIAVGT